MPVALPDGHTQSSSRVQRRAQCRSSCARDNTDPTSDIISVELCFYAAHTNVVLCRDRYRVPVVVWESERESRVCAPRNGVYNLEF